MHSSILLTFSSVRFSVTGFVLRSLIYLDLSFVHVSRYGTILTLLHAGIQWFQHHLLKMFSFFLLYNFGFFVKNQVFIGVWINVRVFNLIPSIHMSVLMPIPSCFYYYSSITAIEVRDGDISRSSFIVQDSFNYSVFSTILFLLFLHKKLSLVI